MSLAGFPAARLWFEDTRSLFPYYEYLLLPLNTIICYLVSGVSYQSIIQNINSIVGCITTTS